MAMTEIYVSNSYYGITLENLDIRSDIVTRWVVARITANFLLPASLIDSNVINHHLGWEFKMHPVLTLEVVRHPKIEYDILKQRNIENLIPMELVEDYVEDIPWALLR